MHSVSQSRLQSLLHPNKGGATVEVQGLPGPSSQSTPIMPSLNLLLECVIEGENRVFSVEIPAQARVTSLKKAIHSERATSILEGIDPHILDLWKPRDNALAAKPANTLAERIKSMGANLEMLEPVDSVSDSFPTQPSNTHVHIVVKISEPPEPFYKRRRTELHELEAPQTPVRSQVAPQKETPPRLRSRELTPAMERALEPFAQYMIGLAEGELDKYFDSTQLEPWVTHLGVTLPSGPMLLLHDLGNCPEDERLAEIFKSETVHVYAVSGSGKTRLCLEGLCHEWGLYISCRGASKNRAAGSIDFDIATPTDPHKNANVARRTFEMLLCARLFVLKRLLEILPPGTDAKTARRRWVLVQAMPPFLRYPSDIFATVLESLRRADSLDMELLSKSMLDEMTKILGESNFPPNLQLFAVVDEAQVAAEYMNESFCSQTTGTDGRPVLHPFYRFLLDSSLFKGIILAGTGLSMNMVQRAVASRSAQLLDERRNPWVFDNLGLFSKDGTDHETYVNKYLNFAPTVSDEQLMRRILYWFPGRYRFTASFIELLLFTQSPSRHRLLSAFVFALTGFCITDAIDLEEREPYLPDSIVKHIESFYGPVGEHERLFGKLSEYDLNYIFNALMRWRIGSQPTAIRIEGDTHQTIASGIGHLKIIRSNQLLTKNKYFAYLCEPLVVLYLSSIFAQRPETTNLSWLSDATSTARNNSSLGFMFEEAVLMVILQMFGGEPRALSDAFHTDQPWGSRKVILVSLKCTADGQMECCPVSWTSGSSDRLGFKATSPAQVIEFLNNPDGKCFLFPDTHMGPDLSWFFLDWETKELMIANAQGKLSETLTPATWQGALQTVSPDFFYTVKKKKGGRTQYAPLKYPGILEDVMNALDVKLGPAEYEPSVSDQHPETRSVSATVEKMASQPQRLTPKYIRIIATPNDHQRELLKVKWKGDVGVLRTECVERYFPNVVWTTPPSVA